jgi:hypothetical protein
MAFLEFITESFWNWIAVLVYVILFFAFVLTALTRVTTTVNIDYQKLASHLQPGVKPTYGVKQKPFLEDDSD